MQITADNTISHLRSLMTMKEWEMSEALCKQILVKDPNNLPVIEILVEILFGQKRLQECLPHAIRGMQLSPTPEKVRAVCRIFCDLNDNERAIDAYKAYFSLWPDSCSPAFEVMYEESMRKTNTPPLPFARRLRFAKLAELVMETLPLTGEVVECGCAGGNSAHLISQILRSVDPSFNGKGFTIYDSFEGLSEPSLEDAIPETHEDYAKLSHMCRKGYFARTEETVRFNLRDFPDITFVKGWLPQSLEGIEEKQYRFVNLDVDLYEPTMGVLEYFYPRLVPGGLIVSDDYNWPGGKKAIDEFCARYNIEAEFTSHHQAIIRKLI